MQYIGAVTNWYRKGQRRNQDPFRLTPFPEVRRSTGVSERSFSGAYSQEEYLKAVNTTLNLEKALLEDASQGHIPLSVSKSLNKRPEKRLAPKPTASGDADSLNFLDSSGVKIPRKSDIFDDLPSEQHRGSKTQSQSQDSALGNSKQSAQEVRQE